MSQSSLLQATAKYILDNVKIANRKLREAECLVMPDGRPPAGSGELFVSIHPGGFRGASFELLDLNHSLNITITIRIDGTPYDRVGSQNIVKKFTGIEEIAKSIYRALHNNYRLLIIANSFLNSNENKWVEPLRLNNSSPPRLVGSEWFNSEKAKESGIIQTLTFADARILEYSDGQDVIGPDFPEDLYNMDTRFGSVFTNPAATPNNS